jgi:hypothetical protein
MLLDLDGADAVVDTALAGLPALDAQLRDLSTAAHAGPYGVRGYLRDPMAARRRQKRLREVRSAAEEVRTTRREIDSRRADLARRRAEVKAQLQRLADVRESAERTGREQRLLRLGTTLAVVVMALVTVGGIVIDPPAATVSQVIVFVYGVYLIRQWRRYRLGQRRMPRLTMFALVTLGALTFAIVLEQFVAPGRLANVALQTDRGVVSGVLIATTDAQTTVGLPDCRLESVPALQIRSIVIRPRTRTYGKSVGTLVLELWNGRPHHVTAARVGRCGQ